MIDSAISKRQENRRKHSFLERKKILHKRENGFTMRTQNTTSLDGSSMKESTPQFHKTFFNISCFFLSQKKLLQLRITKKE